MPYGTESFTDRYGDYKQPTVIDLDQSSKIVINPLSDSIDDIIEQYKSDIELTIKEILSTNAFFAGKKYLTLTQSIDGKLAWNITKINEMKENSDWLFNLRKHLTKAKKEFILNKKL